GDVITRFSLSLPPINAAAFQHQATRRLCCLSSPPAAASACYPGARTQGDAFALLHAAAKFVRQGNQGFSNQHQGHQANKHHASGIEVKTEDDLWLQDVGLIILGTGLP
ncbi:unnamed protein product, partial [Urochloa humidicola]